MRLNRIRILTEILGRHLRKMILGGLLSISIVGLLVGCGLPQVSAETRLFLDLTVDYLDEYQLETIEVGGTPVGGLSALAYDRQQGKFYALSDDRGFESPARFYTLSIELDPDRVQIDRVTVENVTLLTDEAGQPFAPGSIDPEGLALSPDGTLFVSSEGVASEGIAPFIGEFDRATGQLIRRLPLPDYFRPDAAAEAQTLGVRDNLGFEALTVGGTGSGEPYRVFAATESSLLQDTDPDHRESPDSRLLHYIVVGDRSQLIAEHLYQLDPPPSVLTVSNGLVELLSLDRASPFASRGGYFLSLERTFGASGFGAKLFQVSIARATDVSTLTRASGQLDGIESLPKQLLLDLSELELSLDNLEGMTFGPQLQDGTQSLILVSDNNFRDEQITQFLLCRLYESR